VIRLGLEILARLPDRTAVERADVTRTPIAISAPDSAVTLAYTKLVDRLEPGAVIA
jgi:hypothetical protein